jgi:putative FmdB family regulatory protein
MPTYDYKCADCGRIFEKFHGMNETPQVACPECTSANTSRQVSLGAGIVFKGAGFYVNDYKKSGGTGSSAASTATKEKTDTAKSEPAAGTSTPAAGGGETKSAHSCGPGCAH